MENLSKIENKFRYVIVVSKRAKDLLKGAKPKIKSKSKNPIRIAQEEVKQGLVNFRIVQVEEGSRLDREDDVFIGEKLKEERTGQEESAESAAEGKKEQQKKRKKSRGKKGK